MPGNFAYTPATNIVEVTAGTALNPADFASFVIADRAGTYTVMDAIATALNLTLDRLIRPVELRALKITFNLAGTNAGAGDIVAITGTDAWDNAQVESINVAAGNGAYISAKYWRTITDVDCTGFADGVGTINAVQGQWGVIWNHGNGQYETDCIFNIGDEVIETFFAELDKTIILGDKLVSTANSTMRFGEYSDGHYTRRGCYIRNECHFNAYVEWFGTVEFYNTYWRGPSAYATYIRLKASSVIKADYFTMDALHTFYFDNQPNAGGFVTNSNGIGGVSYSFVNPTGTFSNVLVKDCSRAGILFSIGGDGTIAENITFENNTRDIELNYFTGQSWTLINPVGLSTVGYGAGGTKTGTNPLHIQYSCNIHIADKDGVNLAGVTVDCEDQFGNPVWAAGTITTDAAGDIAEQLITYRDYIYSGGASIVTYSPHKFTIYGAGNETMVLDAITVDAPVVWHEELLPALVEGDVRDGVAYGEDSEGNLELPPVGDVEAGEGYGSNGVEFTGTFGVPPVADARDGEGYGAGGAEFEGELDLPAEADVEDGVTFDGGTKEGNFEAPAEDDVEDGVGYGSNGAEFEGDLEIPAIGDVRDGIGFGADGIELEGILDLPSINDVEDGVKYDNDTKEGNFEAPAEEDVEVGIGYGSLGAEFEGTYLGLKGENLTAELEESVNLVGYLEDKVALSGEISNE